MRNVFKFIKPNIELVLCKEKLKTSYEKLCQIKENYDCGISLMEYLSPEYNKQLEKCNKLFDKCQELEKKLIGNK